MNTRLTLQLTRSLRTRTPRSVHSTRQLQSSAKFNMNSTTASSDSPFGTEGNSRVAPSKDMSSIQTLTLNDDTEIPLLGYGTGTAQARMGNKDGTKVDKELVNTIVIAIKAGYYHLDGAEVYGNEAELGAAIKEAGVPREKLFVTTKISGTEVQDTEASFTVSLQKLQLEYVDLYLLHAPFFASGSAEALQKKWTDLEAIQASGRARSIGVSNFLQSDIEAVLKTAKVVPSINQIEHHPFLQHGNLVEFQRRHRIATAAYSPLTAVTKAHTPALDEKYDVLARKYGVTPAEIALRWCIDQGIVTLTTSSKEQRLKSYLMVGQFKLTPKEVEDIKDLGKEKHFRGVWAARFDKDDRR